MNCKSVVHLLSLVTLLLISGAIHAQSIEEEKGTNIPRYRCRILLYDIEGKAGIATYNNHPGFSSHYGLEDGTVSQPVNRLTSSDPAPGTGIPFWWELETPWNGKVRGWARSAIFGAERRFMLPVPGSEAGLELSVEGNFANRLSFGEDVSLVDKLDTPTPLAYNSLANQGIRSIITAAYLPGNVLHDSLGMESHEFDENDLFGASPVVLWGNTNGVPDYSFVTRFSTTVPSGPMMMAVSFDGTTTSTIEFEGRPATARHAHLPFAPLPGSGLPTASQYLQLGEPPMFVMKSTFEAALLGDSVDLTTDLDVACDRNFDEVIDAADMYRYLVFERE